MAPNATRVAAGQDQASDNMSFVLTILKYQDLQTNYRDVALELGINTANNVQRRFKRIVEQHGFKLVNNQVLSADSADARPITNLPASSRHIETPHNSSPAGGTKKASRGVKATSASPTTPTTSKQADTVVDDREAARPTNAKKRAASADAEGHQAATIRATKKAKKESTDDKAANTSNKGNTKVVNKKSGDTTLPIAPKKNSKEVVEAEGNTEDEE